MTDSSGTVVATYQYDPYGNSTDNSGGWQFAGGYLDGSGYDKLGARYDDPRTGRWTQQGPGAGSVVNPASLCRYAYAQDDPANLKHPERHPAATAYTRPLAFVTVALGETREPPAGAGAWNP